MPPDQNKWAGDDDLLAWCQTIYYNNNAQTRRLISVKRKCSQAALASWLQQAAATMSKETDKHNRNTTSSLSSTTLEENNNNKKQVEEKEKEESAYESVVLHPLMLSSILHPVDSSKAVLSHMVLVISNWINAVEQSFPSFRKAAEIRADTENMERTLKNVFMHLVLFLWTFRCSSSHNDDEPPEEESNTSSMNQQLLQDLVVAIHGLSAANLTYQRFVLQLLQEEFDLDTNNTSLFKPKDCPTLKSRVPLRRGVLRFRSYLNRQVEATPVGYFQLFQWTTAAIEDSDFFHSSQNGLLKKKKTEAAGEEKCGKSKMNHHYFTESDIVELLSVSIPTYHSGAEGRKNTNQKKHVKQEEEVDAAASKKETLEEEGGETAKKENANGAADKTVLSPATVELEEEESGHNEDPMLLSESPYINLKQLAHCYGMALLRLIEQYHINFPRVMDVFMFCLASQIELRENKICGGKVGGSEVGGNQWYSTALSSYDDEDVAKKEEEQRGDNAARKKMFDEESWEPVSTTSAWSTPPEFFSMIFQCAHFTDKGGVKYSSFFARSISILKNYYFETPAEDPTPSEASERKKRVYLQLVLQLHFRYGLISFSNAFRLTLSIVTPHPEKVFIIRGADVQLFDEFFSSLKSYTKKMQEWAAKSFGDTFGALANKRYLYSRGPVVPQTPGGRTSSANIVTMHFPSPAPREHELWNLIPSQGEDIYFAPMRSLEYLINQGFWKEGHCILAKWLAADVNPFLDIAYFSAMRGPERVGSCKKAYTRLIAVIMKGCERLMRASSSLRRPGVANRVFRADFQSTTTTDEESEENFMTLWKEYHRSFLAVAGPFLMQESFLERVLTFLIRKLENSSSSSSTESFTSLLKGNRQRVHRFWCNAAQHFLSEVFFPCCRNSTLSPQHAEYVNRMLEMMPHALIAKAFSQVPPPKYPMDEVRFQENRALISYVLTRITPEEVKHFGEVVRPVVTCNPFMLTEKLIQQAIGYNDSSSVMIMLFASLFREAPSLSLKVFAYLIADRTKQFALEDKPGAEVRIGSVITLFVIAWRQNIGVFDPSYLFHCIEELLQVEAKSSVIYAVATLKAVFQHFLHWKMDHEEQYNPLQLQALPCKLHTQWFGSGAAESFLLKWDEKGFSPRALQKNKKNIVAVLSDTSSSFTAQQSNNSALSLGEQILVQLCRFQEYLLDMYADLPGTVEETTLLTFHHQDTLNDLISLLSAIILKPKLSSSPSIVSGEGHHNMNVIKLFELLLPRADRAIWLKLFSQIISAETGERLSTCLSSSASTSPSSDVEKVWNNFLQFVFPAPKTGADSSLPQRSIVEGVPIEVYTLFWLSPNHALAPLDPEVTISVKQIYDRIWNNVEKKHRRSSEVKSEKSSLSRELHKLEEEAVQQENERNTVLSLVRTYLPKIFATAKSSKPENTTTTSKAGSSVRELDPFSFVHHCLLPRAKLSHADAIASMQFLDLLMEAGGTQAKGEGREEGKAKEEDVQAVVREKPVEEEEGEPQKKGEETTIVATNGEKSNSERKRGPVSERLIHTAILDIIKTFISYFSAHFVSFSNAEVHRLGAALQCGFDLMRKWERKKGKKKKVSAFDYYKTISTMDIDKDTLYIEAYLVQTISELLRNKETIPAMIHRNVFLLLEILKISSFPRTEIGLQILCFGVSRHAVRSSKCYASASSILRYYRNLINECTTRTSAVVAAGHKSPPPSSLQKTSGEKDHDDNNNNDDDGERVLSLSKDEVTLLRHLLKEELHILHEARRLMPGGGGDEPEEEGMEEVKEEEEEPPATIEEDIEIVEPVVTEEEQEVMNRGEETEGKEREEEEKNQSQAGFVVDAEPQPVGGKDGRKEEREREDAAKEEDAPAVVGETPEEGGEGKGEATHQEEQEPQKKEDDETIVATNGEKSNSEGKSPPVVPNDFPEGQRVEDKLDDPPAAKRQRLE